MGKNLTQKIIEAHLVGGRMAAGEEIALSIDQTLTQDATGTMAYLQFEALGLPRVRTQLSVSYVDHNLLQTGFESADDHRFLQSVAARYGIYFSRPGNGISHQVHLERFAVPGSTLLGSDSHTPMAGAVGALAIGSGGLDVAVAMAGQPYHLAMPRVALVRPAGKLGPWVAAKDIILELLRRLTVKGGLGKVLEYSGEGLVALSVPERAAIANMGSELGATSSVFPSDDQTRDFLRRQKRELDWHPLSADRDASYDQVLEVDLSVLEPLIARPSSPDSVCLVTEVEATPVAQVCIGSCNNSSYLDLATLAAMLKGKTVHPSVSLVVNPGSRQVFQMIARSGALADLIAAGARILEAACGPCIGMGQAPPTGGVSLRTYNRNFEGRSGTPKDQVYLCSVQVAAAAALAGTITDPRRLGEPPRVELPREFLIDDNMILSPSLEPDTVEIIRGPNIKPVPLAHPLPETIQGRVLLKLGDNVTTDHILPAGAPILPLRSNIPAIAEYTFHRVDPAFPERAREWGGGLVIGGENYGQGSSREHAALAPMYLGVRAILARSFARIHRANLVNFGILPLAIGEEAYQALSQGDEIELPAVREALKKGPEVLVRRLARGREFQGRHDLTPREVEVLLAGGLLNYIKAGHTQP